MSRSFPIVLKLSSSSECGTGNCWATSVIRHHSHSPQMFISLFLSPVMDVDRMNTLNVCYCESLVLTN